MLYDSWLPRAPFNDVLQLQHLAHTEISVRTWLLGKT